MTFCAPASKVVTVLHLRDPAVAASEKPEPSDGATRCGLPLLVAELWVPIAEEEMRPGDSVCRGCRGIADEQGAMW
jgi:hypothetical protein